MKRVVVGTAGHIDHGKTTLVKALTGIDCDRLKEEKERGITLDLGFAYTRFGEDLLLGIVDVPGHERLVRHMVAGAWGIDMVLIVVAADEGIMPQTKEHIDICELLGLRRAVFALTKIDLVDEEMVELAKEEIKDYLKGRVFEGAPIVPCSSVTGQGMEVLKETIRQEALKVEERDVSGIFRVPIDRAFTLKGIGTVVTGTCISGSIRVGEEVELYPLKKRSKIRNIQVYYENVEEARAGERVALNLQGIERDELERGVVVARPNTLVESIRVDALLLFLGVPIRPLRSGMVLRFHTATMERNARLFILERDSVQPGEEAVVQFSFDEPICSLPGDPYILRGSFLVRTIGGGTILDIEAKRHKKGEVQRIKEALLSGSDVKRAEYQLLKGAYAGVSREKLYALVGATERKGEEIIRRLEEHGRAISFPSFLVHTSVFNAYERMLERELGTFFSRNPQKVGMSKEELRSRLPAVPQAVFQRALLELTKEGAFEVDRDMVKLKGVAERTEEIERLEEKIEELLLKGGLTPPSPKELSLLLSLSEAYLRDLIERLIHKGKVVKVRTDMFFHREPLEAFKEKSLALLREKREVGIQDFKHVFDLSRKYLIPLVEYLDSVKLTVRVGEKRILRGA